MSFFQQTPVYPASEDDYKPDTCSLDQNGIIPAYGFVQQHNFAPFTGLTPNEQENDHQETPDRYPHRGPRARPSKVPGRPRGRPPKRNANRGTQSIMKKRPHVEQFLNKMEDLVKTHFHEKVFFSAEETRVELRLENWREKLESENLANEESKVEGKVELMMYITVENVA